MGDNHNLQQPDLPACSPPPHEPSHPHPPPYDSHSDVQEEMRTLFIAGLPGDVKHREIYNLFRSFPGYQSCQLRSGHSSQSFAFAVFVDQQSAATAMHGLNGTIFDLELNLSLHIEFAKSNSRSKRQRTDDGSLYNGNKFKGFPPHQQGFFGNSGNIRKYIDNKKIYALDKLTAQEYRMHIHYQSCTASKTTFYIHLMFLHCMFVFHIHRTLCTLTGFASNIHMHGMGNFAHIMNDYTSTQSHENNNYDSMKVLDNKKQLSSEAYVLQKNAPCSTLFVANLGSNGSEKELAQVFSRCPGFLKLKMQNKNGAPVAFIDFQDVACSTGALNHLQGFVLHSSEGEGMRLEYAKSRMGLRKHWSK